MKVACILLLLLSCLQVAYSGTLVIQQRVPGAYFNPTVCSQEVDTYIRHKYDYYLAYAELCYIA
jgi:hypothetical protein